MRILAFRKRLYYIIDKRSGLIIWQIDRGLWWKIRYLKKDIVKAPRKRGGEAREAIIS